jgi:hypothetical protein
VVTNAITLTRLSPSGGTIVVPEGTPPGAFIPRNSGLLSVGLSIASGREVPWAQLNVYLLSGDSYCGQNLPDSPTWRPFAAGQTVRASRDARDAHGRRRVDEGVTPR